MSVPQTFAVAAGLVSTLRAATGLGAPGDDTADVPVFDGPQVTGEQVLTFVAVGWNGNADDASAGGFTQTFAGMGGGAAATREETGRVDCVIVAGDGGTDFTPLRTSAATTFGLVSDALRASPGLGLGGTVLEWGHITEGEWQQGVSKNGAFLKLNFAVEYLARI